MSSITLEDNKFHIKSFPLNPQLQGEEEIRVRISVQHIQMDSKKK